MSKDINTDYILKEFGNRLKKLREDHNIPMSKLATDIGTTKSGISRYENGKTDPGLTTLIRFAAYFNVTIDWLSGNGDANNVQHSDTEKYKNAINKSIQAGLSPSKLENMVDLYTK